MNGRKRFERFAHFRLAGRGRLIAVAILQWTLITGCYAPLHSDGIAARELPDDYRWPQRTTAPLLNYSSLLAPTPHAYLLGPGDKLDVTIPDLIANGDVQTFHVQVQDDGRILLPRLGPVAVQGLSVAKAQEQIDEALAQGLLQAPSAVVTLAEKATINVLVLGAVKQPGMHALPRYENDIAHALAAAQGFSIEAGDVIEVHRRSSCHPEETPGTSANFPPPPDVQQTGLRRNASKAVADSETGSALTNVSMSTRYGGHSFADGSRTLVPEAVSQSPIAAGIVGPVSMSATAPVQRIRLRGAYEEIPPESVVLGASDVIVIPPKTDKVFYVVGPLSEHNRIRFSLSDTNRDIGNGLLLPEDREIDVVTAVAMAGYIDPIDSPTTVTVHRTSQPGCPMLIRVDLIAARSDPRETILVQSGDIIYLNPDCWWYYRRLTDRVIDRALGTAVGRWLTQ